MQVSCAIQHRHKRGNRDTVMFTKTDTVKLMAQKTNFLHKSTVNLHFLLTASTCAQWRSKIMRYSANDILCKNSALKLFYHHCQPNMATQL